MKRKITVLLLILSLVATAGCAKKEQPTDPTDDEPTAEAVQPSEESTEPSDQATEPSEAPAPTESTPREPLPWKQGYDPEPLIFPIVSYEIKGVGKYDSVTEAFAEYDNVFDLDSDENALSEIAKARFDRLSDIKQYAVAISKNHNFGVLFEFIKYTDEKDKEFSWYYFSQIYAFGNLIDVTGCVKDLDVYNSPVKYLDDEIQIPLSGYNEVECFKITKDTVKISDREEQKIWE